MLNAPLMLTPLQDASGTDTQPTFLWLAPEGATEYALRLSDQTDFTSELQEIRVRPDDLLPDERVEALLHDPEQFPPERLACLDEDDPSTCLLQSASAEHPYCFYKGSVYLSHDDAPCLESRGVRATGSLTVGSPPDSSLVLRETRLVPGQPLGQPVGYRLKRREALAAETRYSWRLQGLGPSGESPWSGVRSFRTGTVKEQRYYYVADHLGSVRATVTMAKDPGTGGMGRSVVQYDDYYPFGLQMPGRSSGSGQDADPTGKPRFTGHELDDETGLVYAGARYLDPVIGRWMSVDPLAEKYPGWSPYNYALNNPLSNIDPDGREVRCETQDECQRAADELNAAHEGQTGITVEETQWEEDASVWWNPFTWGDTKKVSGFKLSTADSDFDWSQGGAEGGRYTMALYDIINTNENVFGINYVSGNTVLPNTLGSTAYESMGRMYGHSGGGVVWISANGNKFNEPNGVVLMHELVSHGHPNRDADPNAINRFYQRKLGYRFPPGVSKTSHNAGSRVTWTKTNLYKGR